MTLYDAVEQLDAARVTAMLAGGASANMVTEEGLTPLIRALQLRNTPLVLALTLGKAKLDWFDPCTTSPLAAAVEYYPEWVPRLIVMGASVHSCISPVTAAVNANNPEMIKYLLSRGASINNGIIAPLHQAVVNGNIEMVELVLAEGGFVDLQDPGGNTALFFATEEQNVAIVDLLLTRQANVELCNARGNTPLISATGSDNVEIVELLLQHDADVSRATNKGVTPLHMTMYNNNLVCAHMLMSQGADVNQSDVFGITPLITATWVDGSDDMVSLLLESNADVNSVASNGMTALLQAIYNGKYWIASTLLRNGANINYPLPDGTTPLHSAVFLQNAEIVQILLHFRANVELAMLDGTKPIHSAARMKSPYVLEQLLAHGSSQGGPTTPLHIAAECGASQHANLLLRYKAEVNAVDRHGAPPIKYAIENEHVDVTVMLVSAGAVFSPSQIPDFEPYQEWASRHVRELKALNTLKLCVDLKRVIFSFLLPPNVTALAWRVMESTS